MSQDENTSAPTISRLDPDPIKLAFADVLADAATAWLHAMQEMDIAAVQTTSEKLYTVALDLDTAIRRRENAST